MEKVNEKETAESVKADVDKNKNLQEQRASILENRKKTTYKENVEIGFDSEQTNNSPVEKITVEKETAKIHEKEYANVLEKLLPDFLHEISSPISSIEYSSENLFHEYNKILSQITALAISIEQAQVIERAINYVNSITSEINLSVQVTDIREKKKNFVNQLASYKVKNPQRAVEFFIYAGIYNVTNDIKWFLSLPSGERLFQLIVSLLSVKQSFAVLDSAKNRERYLVTTIKNYTNKLPENHTEVYDLKTSLETAIVLLNHRLRSCNFIFQYDAQCFINGNIQQIIHVWINLLSNAIEATSGQGIITMLAFKHEEDILVTVQDNGSGIPAEIQSKIFEPYFTTKKTQGGTGIGLHICKDIITEAGGSIALVSQPGNTVFTVTIKNYAITRQ